MKNIVRKKLNFEKDKIFKNINLRPGEVSVLNEIFKYKESTLFAWDTTNSKKFKFDLPKTEFSKENKINFKDYTKPSTEYSFKDRKLTDSHFKEIKETGQFTVRSKVRGLPYVWKLVPILTTGSKTAYNNLLGNLTVAFFILNDAKHRVSTGQVKYFSSFNLLNSLVELKTAFKKIINLLIGVKTIDEQKLFTEIQLKLEKEYLEELKSKGVDFSIHTPYFRKKMLELSSIFEEEWATKKVKYEQEFADKLFSDNELAYKLQEKRLADLLEFVGKFDVQLEGKGGLISDYIRAIDRLQEMNEEVSLQINKLKEKTADELKQKHRIKSGVESWLNEQVYKITFPQIYQIMFEWNAKILQELSIFEQPKIIVESFTNLRQNYTQKFAELKARYLKDGIPENETTLENLNQIKGGKLSSYLKSSNFVKRDNLTENKVISYDKSSYFAKREFTVLEQLPFNKYVKSEDGLKLIKTITHKLSSKQNFWRFKLHFKRFEIWTKNIFRTFYNIGINSAAGLKALYQDEVVYDYELTTETKEIKEKKSQGYKPIMRTLLKSIREAREAFEKRPDTGFFSKSIERIFNYFTTYIITGMIVIPVVGVVYPICILAISSACLAICLISPLISLGLSTFQYLFNICVFDVDGDLRSFALLALPKILIIDIGIYSFLQAIISICFLVLQPILALGVTFLVALKYLIRRFYNALAFPLVKWFGRIPSTDSILAYKIGGPGISRNFYNYVLLEDSLVLIHAELEKLYMSVYNANLFTEIEEPSRVERIVRETFSQANLNYYLNSEIEKSVSTYATILREQIEKEAELTHYPKVNKVKFTKEELQLLRKEALVFIKEYVKANGMDFIWNTFKLKPNSWIQLTNHLLEKVFGKSIFEPFEDVDFRVEIDYTNETNEPYLKEIKSITPERKIKTNLIALEEIYNEPFNIREYLLRQDLH